MRSPPKTGAAEAVTRDAFRQAWEAGEEAVDLSGFTVPILTESEQVIIDLYHRCGRDYNGRVLVSEENAMLERLRRLGWEFDEAAVLECWGAISDEESKWRADQPKKE